jgi:programmed cell death 8 (apoptosis-inducing factor)
MIIILLFLEKPYKHQSMFWSDLGTTVGYEAIGLIDSSQETVGIFAQINTDKEELKEAEGEKKETQSNDSAGNKSSAEKEAQSDSNDNKAAATDNYSKGILFYTKNNQIVGILLWNVFNRISIARKILQSDEKFDDLNEVAKLFDIFEQHHPQQPQDKEEEEEGEKRSSI